MGQVPMRSFDPFLNHLSPCSNKAVPSTIAAAAGESLRTDQLLHHIYISIHSNDPLLFSTDDINIHSQ